MEDPTLSIGPKSHPWSNKLFLFLVVKFLFFYASYFTFYVFDDFCSTVKSDSKIIKFTWKDENNLSKKNENMFLLGGRKLLITLCFEGDFFVLYLVNEAAVLKLKLNK